MATGMLMSERLSLTHCRWLETVSVWRTTGPSPDVRRIGSVELAEVLSRVYQRSRTKQKEISTQKRMQGNDAAAFSQALRYI